MAALVQNRPRRWLKWWLVPLIVFGLAAVLAVVTISRWSQVLDGDDHGDSELIRQIFLSGRLFNTKEVRAQIGEERFWRSIKRAISNRPSDAEARLREWMERANPKRPRLLQTGIDWMLLRLQGGWQQRDARLRTAEMLLASEFVDVAIPALPELMQLAESSDFIYAMEGADALGNLRGGAIQALPVLLGRLERSQGGLAPALVESIGKIDPRGTNSAGRMVRLLPKAPRGIRIALLPQIGAYARYQPELATNLWAAVREDRDLAFAAVQGLSRARQLTPERLERFRRGFQSADPDLRWLSLNLVAASGTSAAGFIPELRQPALYHSPDQDTALGALKLLLSAEARQSREVRLAAAEALLASDNSSVAWEALTALPSLGATEARTLSLASQALGHVSANVRARAAEMLGQLGTAARPARPQLLALRNDEWKMVRDAVEIALPKIGE
ncbi:MAG TPA: HEAT repeat domain-containing protein [Candidatus Limnocylindria bacterium]|jgi:hypothetical protein|nr:HEAT repeat domain-containing protein [Candidatus Limnocylindria bacterium]